MAEHCLKTWPHEHDAVKAGTKTFEVRRNDDRDFAVGDVLHLQRWDPGERLTGFGKGAYITPVGTPWHDSQSADTVTVRVTYILHGGRFGLPPGLCVMAIEREEQGR